MDADTISRARGCIHTISYNGREKEMGSIYGTEEYKKGVLHGIKIMQQRMLLACENHSPIAITDYRGDLKEYFIQTDTGNVKKDGGLCRGKIASEQRK